MQSLLFFNKEGDNLNFRWNENTERWEGDILFDRNSNDVFKTAGIYTFEKIPSFEYENPGNLKLKKFQLFNEFRFDISGAPTQSMTQSVSKIEPVNSDQSFFSKWIYGNGFDSKFPVGSQIIFNTPIYEFTNTQNKTYTVVGSKQDAVLILSGKNNRKFGEDYPTYGTTLSNITISGINSVGIYNSLDKDTYRSPLSEWSEPNFITKTYLGKRFTLVNTDRNDGVYTMDSPLLSRNFYRYSVGVGNFTQSGMSVALELLTDLPTVYKGTVTTNPVGYPTNVLKLTVPVPDIIHPGSEISLSPTNFNRSTFVVDEIPSFLGNANSAYYGTHSQVIYENRIWECVTAYQWTATSSIVPGSTYGNWTYSNYIRTTTPVVGELLADCEIKLASNKVRFFQSFTQSETVTLASAAQNFKETFGNYGIGLSYSSGQLSAELIWPGKYAKIEFYSGFGGTVSLGSEKEILENLIRTKEHLKTESNVNTNQNYSYNIVFPDLDEYGLNLIVNGQEYQQEIVWVYNGSVPDIQRTVDRTLRAWLVKWYVSLVRIGIIPTLNYVGDYFSPYFNTIVLKTEYPNVPLSFEVKVGTTADYYIEHSEVVFSDMSNYLSININGTDYSQSVGTVSGTFSYDVEGALDSWVDSYSGTLSDYGILVSSVNRMLIFRIRSQNQKLDYTIRVGRSSLPGSDLYQIFDKTPGNFGALLVSNETTLPSSGTASFEDQPFATGQIVGINNSIRPYNNQEYNILSLDPDHIVLSYQGPFWGETEKVCGGPFVLVAFNGGFTQATCPPPPPPPVVIAGAGEFNSGAFLDSFSLRWSSPNTYRTSNFSIGNTSLVDMMYLQLTSCVYIFGTKISVIDSATNNLINLVDISAVDGIKSVYNPVNDYIYYLTETKIYVVDPTQILVNDIIISTIILSGTGKDIEVNFSTGDVYVIFESSPTVSVWILTNFTSTSTSNISLSSDCLELEFNESESDMYVTTQTTGLVRIDGSARTVSDTYVFPENLTSTAFYEPISSSIYVFGTNSTMYVVNNGTYSADVIFPTGEDRYLIYNNLLGQVNISQNLGTTQSFGIKPVGGTSSRFPVTAYGDMAINQFDGGLYLADQMSNQIFVIDTVNNVISHTEPVTSRVSKMIYNQDRTSIYGILPNEDRIVEITVEVYAELVQTPYTYSVPDDNLYGTLSPTYVQKSDIWLKTREYLRKPRFNFNDQPQVKFVWKWETDEYPQIFLYDFSGNQLTQTGPLAYVGQKPLPSVNLNKTPNRDLEKVTVSESQQTVFPEIVEVLDYVDSETNISIVPEPMETFIGFRGDDEGPVRSHLMLYLREEIDFTITTTATNLDIMQFTTIVVQTQKTYGKVIMNSTSSGFFTRDDNGDDRGLRIGQIVKIYVRDVTNSKNKWVSLNNGVVFRIREIYAKYMVVDFLEGQFREEFTKIEDYPSVGKTTYLSIRFVVQDKSLGRFRVSGQTEIEDVRYKIELSNTGHNITADDVFIFKSYDINEEGVDWVYLNQKRKEMMMVRHDIFPYVGSYKAIINAINYFGYNDLHLYEYYRNIRAFLDNGSANPDYFKLFKVEIPDIFDNTVEGWKVNDFLKHTMPNPNYEDTNLFNLTYLITDKEGNNLLTYSLMEVIVKLQGLKNWLQRKVIPLSHRILDITGRADFVGTTTIVHRNYDATILNVRQSMTPIDFNLNEAYLMPVNSGSTVYTCHIDFRLGSTHSVPDYFNMKIRTYKTFKEWNPFTVYSVGDEVTYYGNVYESAIDNNTLMNPRKYESVSKWNTVTDYTLGQYVNYEEMIYQFVGTQSWFQVSGTGSTVTPLKDIVTNGSLSSWIDMTEWKKMNLVPVQTIHEYRTGTHSFNFTVDSNIDPFICIEVTSDNGYGQAYTVKKNYEIRGLNDLVTRIVPSDILGPFQPIVPVTTPL